MQIGMRDGGRSQNWYQTLRLGIINNTKMCWNRVLGQKIFPYWRQPQTSKSRNIERVIKYEGLIVKIKLWRQVVYTVSKRAMNFCIRLKWHFLFSGNKQKRLCYVIIFPLFFSDEFKWNSFIKWESQRRKYGHWILSSFISFITSVSIWNVSESYSFLFIGVHKHKPSEDTSAEPIRLNPLHVNIK